MTNILRIDASPRTGIAGQVQHGSQTRRLTELFINDWISKKPDTKIKHRDVGKNPPKLIDEQWLISQFGYASSQAEAQQNLALSDQLIEELHWAHIIIVGVPMYNFGPPAHLKAYIDNIVRINITYRFDESLSQPYIGLLNNNKVMVILSSRGGHDFDDQAPFKNHVEPSIKTAFNFIGIQKFHEIAIEYQEYGGDRLEKSIHQAEFKVTELVQQLIHNNKINI